MTYRPEAFAEDRPEILRDAMARIGFAALVTTTGSGLQITHAPVVVRTAGETAVLEAHVARANDHWRIAGAGPSVAIFQGPQAYVSPGFYPTKALTGKAVPTWLYVTVHAHGRLRAVDDGDWLTRHVDALTDRHEADRLTPWATSDAPAPYMAAMTRGIVGLELAVDRLEGTWKLNQHKGADDVAGTIAGLAGEGGEAAEIAALLAERRGAK